MSTTKQEDREKLEEFFRDLLYEENLTEKQYQTALKLTFKEMGITFEGLLEDLQEGKDNGYSTDEQLTIVKNIMEEGL